MALTKPRPTRWPLPSTSTTSSSPRGSPGSCARGSAWPRSASSSSAPPGPDAIVPLTRTGLPRLPRPQAPRHPHHRRQGGARARGAGRVLPDASRLRRRPHAACRRRRPGRRRRRPVSRRRSLAVTVLTSDDGAPPHILGNRVAAALDARLRRHRVRGRRRGREAKRLAPDLIAVVPGIRPCGRLRPRPGRVRRPPRRRSTPAPTSSSSAGR